MIARLSVARLLCKARVQCNVLLGREIWRVFTRQKSIDNQKSMTPIRRVRYVWKNLFGKYLLLTNTISSGALMLLGDAVAQDIDRRVHLKEGTFAEYVSYKRLIRMFLVGVIMGPIHHYVYIWMDAAMPAVTIRNTMRKILLDQCIMSPTCILLFFYIACYFEDRTWAQAHEEVYAKFFYVYLTDWAYWPVVQFVNFQYITTKYRVTFVNICTALYNIFLSYVKHDFEGM